MRDAGQTHKGRLTNYDFLQYHYYPIDVACENFERITPAGRR